MKSKVFVAVPKEGASGRADWECERFALIYGCPADWNGHSDGQARGITAPEIVAGLTMALQAENTGIFIANHRSWRVWRKRASHGRRHLQQCIADAYKRLTSR